MNIVSINVTKGGCSKTTTCQALGELFGRHMKVLCVDLDLQMNLTTVSGIDIMECQEHNLYTLLKGTSTLEECIYKTEFYDIIPSSINLTYADNEFNHMGKERLLKEALKNADYDLILLDCPPAIGLPTIWALSCCTHTLIPSECSYLSVLGIQQLLSTIETVKKYSNPDLEILGFLLIKFNPRQNLNQVVLNNLEALAQSVGSTVFPVKIKETVKIREAHAMKMPLTKYCQNSSAMLNYKELHDYLEPILSN